MQRGGETYYYHFDGLGSVTNLTDSSGSTTETYSYDAYGQPSTTSSIGNPYGFTGRHHDSETGLYYYRARYYSPSIGRFLQKDPMTWGPDDPKILFTNFNDFISTLIKGIVLADGLQNPSVLNRYLYVSNNPINWIDPFGFDKRKPWWRKLIEGRYFGTGYGEEAIYFYAQQSIDPTKKWYEKVGYWTGGLFASLWTPETYQATGWTLVSAYFISQNLYKTSIKPRTTLGKDGAISEIVKVKSKLTGKTIKVIHRVIRKGKIIHRDVKFFRFFGF